MRKILMITAIILCSAAVALKAQDKDWKSANNELNIGLKPFALGISDFQYKTRLAGKSWLRTGITDLNFWDAETGFRLGIEKQRNLALRSRLTYGLEAGSYFDYDRFDNAFSRTSFDIGIPVGVQLHLTRKLIFGIESRPSIGIFESYIDDEGFRNENFGTGIDFFTGLRGYLGYRF